MNTLYFNDSAPPVPDFMAIELAEQLLKRDIHTSNGLVVTEARVLFKQNKIPKFRIVFNGDEVEMDNEADIRKWPVGFGDRLDKLHQILFGW